MTVLAALSLMALTLISSPVSNFGVGHAPWPTFHQNAQHTGLSPFKGPSSPILKWKFSTGGSILSSPMVASGVIYVGSDDGNLYALSGDGVLKWKFATGGAIESSPAVGPKGTIYVGSDDGNLYAINRDGSLKWKLNTGSSVVSSPTVGPDGTVYVGSLNGHLYALHPDGTLRWIAPQCCAGIYDSPAIAPDGTIYVGIDDPVPNQTCSVCLLAVNVDGTLKWGAITGQVEASSPAVGHDGSIYIGSTDSIFSALHPDGSSKWNLTGRPDETFGSSAAIGHDGTVYVASSEASCLPLPLGCSGGGNGTTRLYAIGSDGNILWRFSATSNLSGSQVFCCIYYTVSSPAIDVRGVAYAGGVDGNLYAVGSNGTLLWKFVLDGAIGSSPAIDRDGTIYVGSTDGNLYAIGNNNSDNNQDGNL